MSPTSRGSSMASASSDRSAPPVSSSRLGPAWFDSLARWVAQSWMLIAFFVCFFLFWEKSVDWFHIPKYILNKPSEIVEASWVDVDRLLPYTGITALEAVIGYVVAIIVAVPMGLSIAFSSILRRTIYPFFVS